MTNNNQRIRIINAEGMCEQKNKIVEQTKHLTRKIHEGTEKINALLIDGSGHLENGVYYAKTRETIIQAITKLDSALQERVFAYTVLDEFRKEPISTNSFGIFEYYTKQYVIDYINQVVQGYVKIIVYGKEEYTEDDIQIEFYIEIYQTINNTENLCNRIFMLIKQPAPIQFSLSELDGFQFLRKAEKWDFMNLHYNHRQEMSKSAILDNMQIELGSALEIVTGIFYFDLVDIMKINIAVRRANYRFTDSFIKIASRKVGFIIETYVRKGYRDTGIQLEFFQLVYKRTENENVLVALGVRDIIFFNTTDKRLARMNFKSPDTIQKRLDEIAESKKREEEFDRKMRQENGLPPKVHWPYFYCE